MTGRGGALSPIPPADRERPVRWQFEHRLAAETLNERPRQTSVDFFVETDETLICLEAKWTEAGVGACSCPTANKMGPRHGRCSDRVLDRPAYWQTAEDLFGLPALHDGVPCPLSFTYQAIRYAAAALALARPDQCPVFALVYDAENPYFAGCGQWPGWPAILQTTFQDADTRLRFRAVSWQALIEQLPLDEAVRAWAVDKHKLAVPAQTEK